MSLRVWLPLNGDLRNQGISSAHTIISTGSSVDAIGKIGQCMKITSTTDLQYIPDFNNYGLSLSGWFKVNQAEIAAVVDALNYTSTASIPTGNLLGNTSYGGIGLIWRGNNHYDSGAFSSITAYATLRTASVNEITAGATMEFDTWIHLTLTWDPNTHILSLYKNGNLIGSKTFAAFTNGVSRTLYLNYKAIYGGNGPAANIPLYCNDIRVYDHCLSAVEVKEIAQGLVLHYKLDQERIIDSSGYGHNGIVVGNSVIEENSPRYNYCIKLPAAADKINCGRGGMVTDSITVNFWLKSTNWSYPISCAQSGGWNFEASGDYFRFPVNISGGVGYKYGASTTTRATICNNQWHMITGVYDRVEGHVKIYVDGELDNDYNANTHNEIRYNASNSIWVGAEATGSSTTASNGMTGNFSDLRIYCTALSAENIKELYNTPMKIDNHKNIHTFTFTENDKNKLQKYGSLDCAQIHQWPLTNFLHCDHTIYTEPDGSKWVHIFHHNNPAASKFATTDTFTTYVYKSEDQWFDVAVCDHAPRWELMVKQLSKSNLNQKYRWVQSVNPMTATYAQVAANLITRNTSDEYTQFSIGGLYKKNSSVYISSNTGSASSWWGGIGCFKNYQGGIPGFGGNSDTNNIVTTGYIDLYLRIDNLDLPVKNFDIFDWYADGYIER